MNNESLSFEDIIKKLSIDDSSNNTTKEDCSSNTAYKTLISCITSLPPKQFSLLSSLIGILLIGNLDVREQFILGRFINNIGQTILTAAAQEQINKKVE